MLISCKSKVIERSLSINEKEEINYIPYYLKVYEADSLFMIKKYEHSYRILDSLFKKYEPKNTDGYAEYSKYIASSVITGKTIDLKVKVKKAFTDFGTVMFNGDELKMVFDSIENLTKLSQKDIEDYRFEYEKKINLDLRKKIDIMLKEDQSVRMENYDSVKIKFFKEKHKNEIEDILKNYGYPSTKLIGFNSYKANDGPIIFDPILAHQDISFQKKILPLMLDSLKKGECSPKEYASVYDRVCWGESILNEKPKQIYGTFPNIELKYPKQVDSLRNSIGLPRLNYEKWVNSRIFKQS